MTDKRAETRELFIDYLRTEIRDTDKIIVQMELINSPVGLIQRYNAELLAMKVVLKKLEDTETMEVK